MTTRTVTRFEQRKQRTRRQLMEAAGELLIEKGFDRMSIQDITDRADVGRGTFYIHFQDKDDIVWEVLREHTEATTAQFYERLAREPFPRREYLSWLMFFQMAEGTREVTRAMTQGNVSARLNQRFMQYVASVYERNLRAGNYSAQTNLPLEVFAQFIAGATMQLMIWWLTTPNPYSAEQMTDMLFEMVYRQQPSAAVKAPFED